MPDTVKNQRAYPQPETQEPGCGFPVMRIVAAFSLATGAILELAKGPLSMGERTLFHSLWGLFNAGDVLLTDCGFCGYADMYLLKQRRIDSVMRNHQRRTVGIELVRKLGKGDRLINWIKTKACPKWMTKNEWKAMPKKMLLREITYHVEIPGFRTEKVIVVTTLLDPVQYPTHALRELYRRRWMAELYLRDIKTSMKMDVLRCKTPQMIHKELCMHVIAYNLIRALMLEASRTHNVALNRVSFKGTVSTIRQWAPILAATTIDDERYAKMTALLIQYIAKDTLPNRPNRSEPRARKRRPKNYQLLSKPRHIFREIQHRNLYRKGLS